MATCTNCGQESPDASDACASASRACERVGEVEMVRDRRRRTPADEEQRDHRDEDGGSPTTLTALFR